MRILKSIFKIFKRKNDKRRFEKFEALAIIQEGVVVWNAEKLKDQILEDDEKTDEDKEKEVKVVDTLLKKKLKMIDDLLKEVLESDEVTEIEKICISKKKEKEKIEKEKIEKLHKVV